MKLPCGFKKCAKGLGYEINKYGRGSHFVENVCGNCEYKRGDADEKKENQEKRK